MNKITNTNQDDIRTRLIEYQKTKGVKWIFISNKIGIPHYVLSYFKNGKQNLWDTTLFKLDNFLKNENF